jgi:hypothetical protein
LVGEDFFSVRAEELALNARGRQFGQFPDISVPESFDDPLPDAEIVAWEGKPRD